MDLYVVNKVNLGHEKDGLRLHYNRYKANVINAYGHTSRLLYTSHFSSSKDRGLL